MRIPERGLRFLLDGLWPQLCPMCELPLDRSADVLSRSIHTLCHVSCLEGLPREAELPAEPRPRGEGVLVRAWLRDCPEFFSLLHAVKYGGRPSLLLPLAEGLARCALRARWIPPRACLVPVPDDPWRLSERGFSPAGRLAAAIAHLSGCEIRGDLLSRRRAAESLARLRDSSSRRRHQEALWGVGRLSEISRARPLLLIDDQITTGSTASALVRLLGLRGNPLLVLCLAAAKRAPGEV
jgi:predicted amidophosphoribosyltransferase